VTVVGREFEVFSFKFSSHCAGHAAYSPAGGGSLVVSAYNSGHLIRLDAATGAWDTSFGTSGLLDVGDIGNGESSIGVAYNATGNFIYYTLEDGSPFHRGFSGLLCR